MSDNQGTPQSPFHVTKSSWHEDTKRQQDYIRDTCPFDGLFESYVKKDRTIMVLPEQFIPILEGGGVVVPSSEGCLMIFGKYHWRLYQRQLSKLNAFNPVNNDLLRHINGSKVHFSELEEGGVFIPGPLLDYADIGEHVAIIGMTYHAEIWGKTQYLEWAKGENAIERRQQYRKATFN